MALNFFSAASLFSGFLSGCQRSASLRYACGGVWVTREREYAVGGDQGSAAAPQQYVQYEMSVRAYSEECSKLGRRTWGRSRGAIDCGKHTFFMSASLASREMPRTA
jgi:hypothetical protein